MSGSRWLQETVMGTASNIVNAYLTAFCLGRFDEIRALFSEDFDFTGPFSRMKSRQAFFDGASRLVSIVRGHRLLRQWEDGDEVSSMYELRLETPSGAGTISLSEWDTVRDGRLVRATLIFDTAAFRAIVPGR